MKCISSLLIIAIVVVQISTIFPIGSGDGSSKAFVIGLNKLFTNSSHRIAEDSYCEDSRISCNDDGQIRVIELVHQHLSGFPVGITAIKDTLEKLSIVDADLKGNIPSQIYELTKLTHLNLERNKFTGTLSNDIGNLKELTILDLGKLYLKGSIPKGLYSLTRLEQLNLGENNFSDSLSEDIGNLQNLISLDIRDSSLSGKIPDNLYSLKNLRLLDLSMNKFSGSLSGNIGNLKNLYYLNLSNSGVYGPIPDSLYSLANLEQLDLANNNISGKLSSKIGKLTDLVHINLANNSLEGFLPSEISKLVRLEVLELQRNYLDGPVPDLSDLTKLIYFNISSATYDPEAECIDHISPPPTGEGSYSTGSVNFPPNDVTHCRYGTNPALDKVEDPQEPSSAGLMLHTPKAKTILSMVACTIVLQIMLH